METLYASPARWTPWKTPVPGLLHFADFSPSISRNCDWFLRYDFTSEVAEVVAPDSLKPSLTSPWGRESNAALMSRLEGRLFETLPSIQTLFHAYGGPGPLFLCPFYTRRRFP